MNVRVESQVNEWLKTEDLSKLENFEKIPEILGIDGEYSASQSKDRFWQLSVCSCHVTYSFQSEPNLYSFLNVKELLARRRREIWSLSDCNWTQTHNHSVRKRTLNHLTKWLSVLSGCGFESSCRHLNFSFATASGKELLDIQATIECGFTLKRVRDIAITYSQMHRADKYSQHSSII